MNDAQRFLLGYDFEAPLAVERVDPPGEDGLARLSYRSANGERVPALLALGAPGGAAVLLQHGGGESKDHPLIRMLLRRWSAAGLTCLAIDAPGHGERAGGAQAPRRSFFEYIRLRLQNAIDLRRAIDLLQCEAGIDPGRIGYWGVSMGGSVGVMLLAADSRVRAACLCLAGARSRRAWPEVDPGVERFVAANLDLMALAPLTAGREVLLLNGKHDETVPAGDARRLFDALGEPKAQRWFAAGHRVTPAMLRASKEFFDRALA